MANEIDTMTWKHTIAGLVVIVCVTALLVAVIWFFTTPSGQVIMAATALMGATAWMAAERKRRQLAKRVGKLKADIDKAFKPKDPPK